MKCVHKNGCPDGFYCEREFCCAARNPCSYSTPYLTTNGALFKCSKEKCPYGFSCTDTWKIKVCCPEPKNKCPPPEPCRKRRFCTVEPKLEQTKYGLCQTGCTYKCTCPKPPVCRRPHSYCTVSYRYINIYGGKRCMVRCKYSCRLPPVPKCPTYTGEYGNLCHPKYTYATVYGGRYPTKCKLECSCPPFPKCPAYPPVYANYGQLCYRRYIYKDIHDKKCAVQCRTICACPPAPKCEIKYRGYQRYCPRIYSYKRINGRKCPVSCVSKCFCPPPPQCPDLKLQPIQPLSPRL